ncbi:glycosyltransferase [Nakamurella sp. GG22]
MRIAITTGVLRTPPTYFIAQHARLLQENADFGFFARSAKVDDDLPGRLHVPAGTSPEGGFVRKMWTFLSAPIVCLSIIRYRPDVIHQHFATWSGPALWAARMTGAPLLVTLHGYDVVSEDPIDLLQKLRVVWAQYGLRRLIRHGCRFLAVSEYLRSQAIMAGIPPECVLTLPLGVDTEYFNSEGRELITSLGRQEVIFIGRLAQQKGGSDLIRAMATVRQPYRLSIVGDGPERSAWEELARTLGVEVTFTGQISRSLVRERLTAATILVQPSVDVRGRREPAGLTLLEAQACGVPVIANNSGGMPDMLLDGITGVLVPEGDVEALAQAVEELLDLDLEGYRQLSASARNYAHTSGNGRIAAARLLTLYKAARLDHPVKR